MKSLIFAAISIAVLTYWCLQAEACLPEESAPAGKEVISSGTVQLLKDKNGEETLQIEGKLAAQLYKSLVSRAIASDDKSQVGAMEKQGMNFRCFGVTDQLCEIKIDRKNGALSNRRAGPGGPGVGAIGNESSDATAAAPAPVVGHAPASIERKPVRGR